MKLRYAKRDDFDVLIEGLEKNRLLENRPGKGIRAKASDKEQFRKAIRDKTIRIVEDKGQPVAFLYFRTDFNVMYVNESIFWVDLIYVREGHRRKGVGRLLYKDAIKIAKKKGFKKIVIDIFESNDSSRDFHKKLGFRPIYTIYDKRI